MMRLDRLEPRRLLTYGTIETGFGGGDGIIVPSSTVDTVVEAVLPTSNGRFLIVERDAIGRNDEGVKLRRFNADGSNDTTFGIGGGASYFIDGDPFVATDALLQSDGKIVVVGYLTAGTQGGRDTAILRFNANGLALDNTFGAGGSVILDYGGGADQGNSIKLLNNQFYIGMTGFIGAGADFVVARINASNGGLDTSFGVNGFAEFSLNATETLADIALDNVGNVYAVGTQLISGTTNGLVVRFNNSGLFDNSFGTAGVLSIDLGGNESLSSAAVDFANGRVVAGGNDGTNPIAVAISVSTGQLDSSFDGDGIAVANFGAPATANDVLVDPLGRVILGGASGSDTDFVIARFNPSGSLDGSFDIDGLKTINATIQSEAITAMALTDDAGLLLGGRHGLRSALVRLRGLLDAEYLFDEPTSAFAQPSVRIQLPGNVDFPSITAADFFVLNRTTNAVIPTSDIRVVFVPAIDSVDIQYIPNNGIWPDADIRITLNPNAITAGGLPIRLGADFDFFHLSGDADRDRDVDFNDLVTLARNYGQTGKTFSEGNFDYSADGQVGFNDLVILARNYNKTLSQPLAAMTAVVSLRSKSVARDVLG